MLLNNSMKDFSYFKDMAEIPPTEFMLTHPSYEKFPYTCSYEFDDHTSFRNKLDSVNWRFSEESESDFYKHNSLGFRNDQDFDDVDWENTCAIVGCSHVYGQAIENHNTISSILTSEYNIPTMNFGVAGASNRIIHNNAIHAMKKYNPKKVIIIWSYPNRNHWTHNYNVKNEHWEHTNIGGSVILTPHEAKLMIRTDFVPYEFVHMDYSHHTLYECQLYKDIHKLLGTVQYGALGRNNGILQELKWIEPKDMTYYKMNSEFESNPQLFDWDNLKHMKYVDDFYARDIRLADSLSEAPRLGHYGRSINRDIADLIYRKNFK